MKFEVPLETHYLWLVYIMASWHQQHFNYIVWLVKKLKPQGFLTNLIT
jgi:hypothetical protein